jgi:hypothetical protein
VFVEEHVRARAGPQRGVASDPHAGNHKAPLATIAGSAREPDAAGG